MLERREFLIDGQWVKPHQPNDAQVMDPSTEQPVAVISLGSEHDVDRAVDAAVRALPSFSRTTREEWIALLERIGQFYESRSEDLANTVTLEVGAPSWLAKRVHVPMGLSHVKATIAALKNFEFEFKQGSTLIRKEPIGVCALITPWNWPLNQIMCKVLPALAAGCTMVLKPSEVAPLNAMMLADILMEAGIPPGVLNLVNGDGPVVGDALSRHPKVDMVSFTGSTRAGIAVAKAAADTVKRVQQELGGKSAAIVLPDADLEKAAGHIIQSCFLNSGQSCNAPTRLPAHESQRAQIVELVRKTAEAMKVGEPTVKGTTLGPVISRVQHERIQSMISGAIVEGATPVVGGPGKPEGLERGYYVRPTVFVDVEPQMTIARDEVFGPVLTVLFYRTEEEAISLANDSPYGLSGYVYSGSAEKALSVAAQMRTGTVHLNGALPDPSAPFGGYKQSGNGREWGKFGLEEMMETKAVLGLS